MPPASFWEALELLYQWQQKNLPGIDSRQGTMLLIWLLKNSGQSRPIGELYKTGRISEPTMRGCVRTFVAHGLAVIERDEADARHRFIRGTAKLLQKVQEYRARLVELGKKP